VCQSGCGYGWCDTRIGMIVAGQRLPIMIATRPVDFRCGHQALALMVQTELKLDPHSGITVIFRSKRGDRLKILVWDGTGLVLTYKILAADLRRIYEATNAEMAAMELDCFEAKWADKYASIAPAWRRAWQEVIPFFAFDPAI